MSVGKGSGIYTKHDFAHVICYSTYVPSFFRLHSVGKAQEEEQCGADISVLRCTSVCCIVRVSRESVDRECGGGEGEHNYYEICLIC